VNKFEPGAAPHSTLGLKVDLQRLAPRPLALKPMPKGHVAHRAGRFTGYPIDTPG
jgi:hypothetical protein